MDIIGTLNLNVLNLQPTMQESFVRKYSASTENSRELEVAVDFEFLTKQQMADDHNMTENLFGELHYITYQRCGLTIPRRACVKCVDAVNTI